MNIIEVRDQTPRLIASEVVRMDASHWWVACEHSGCQNVITVSRVHWEPVNGFDPDTAYIEVRLTDPPARRCAAHGPFPER